jgi:prepilin-type processing-associated H-X9-DG protein
MTDQLLDYLLDRLDDGAKRDVEARLQTDSALRRQLELLRQALAPLAADQEIVPPRHLAVRTIALVAEHACRTLPHAPAPARSESYARPWWRRADVLVAASVLAVFVGVGLPWLTRLRSPAAIEECKNNLRMFHVALKTFEDQHKRFPLSDEAPRNVAGIVVPVLQQAGVLADNFSVRCPGHGPFQRCTLSMDDINAMSPEQFAQHAPNLLMSYAFTLGYRDEAGVWHSVNRAADAPDNAILIFADRAPPGRALSNSTNHGGRGQNVLYLDGHVQFVTIRNLAGDDIYLNRANCVAAGLGSRDTVLGPSASQP